MPYPPPDSSRAQPLPQQVLNPSRATLTARSELPIATLPVPYSLLTPANQLANSLLPADYPQFLTALQEQIRATQVRAALAVNAELVQLY